MRERAHAASRPCISACARENRAMRTRAKLRVAIAVALHVASSLATAPIPTAQTPYEYQIERFVLYTEYQDGFYALCIYKQHELGRGRRSV